MCWASPTRFIRKTASSPVCVCVCVCVEIAQSRHTVHDLPEASDPKEHYGPKTTSAKFDQIDPRIYWSSLMHATLGLEPVTSDCWIYLFTTVQAESVFEIL